MTTAADVAGASDACWYFAYASNLSRAVFVERRGMRPLATRRARLDGYRLRFDLPIGPGERGVANVEPDLAAHVWGAVYLLLPADCERLDRTEGVPMGVYRRVAIGVTIDGGEILPAFTYRSSWSSPGRKPSPRYLDLVLTGAHEHTLPADYIASLQSLERAVDERLTDA